MRFIELGSYGIEETQIMILLSYRVYDYLLIIMESCIYLFVFDTCETLGRAGKF